MVVGVVVVVVVRVVVRARVTVAASNSVGSVKNSDNAIFTNRCTVLFSITSCHRFVL